MTDNSQPIPAKATTRKVNIMQAIETKFLGPTNTRGSRIKASCWRTSVTVNYDYSASMTENHKAAIEALVCKLNNDCLTNGNNKLWQVVAMGESVDAKGKTAIIELV